MVRTEAVRVRPAGMEWLDQNRRRPGRDHFGAGPALRGPEVLAIGALRRYS